MSRSWGLKSLALLGMTMRGSGSLLACLLPPLLLLGAAPGPAGALSEEEKHVMVELHNLYRAQVSPPATNMLQMVSAAPTPANPFRSTSGFIS